MPDRREPTPGTEPMPDVEEMFEEIEVDSPLVGIIMGSANDKPKMQPAGKALEEAGIRYEVRVMSAHRTPDKVVEYCKAAQMRGLKVIIAGAGMSAALPGVAAAHTSLPVIGVPILGKSLGGHRRAAHDRADAPGRPGRLHGRRRRQERRPLRGPDHRRLAGLDPPLHPRGDRRRLDPAAQDGGLARGRAGRHRGAAPRRGSSPPRPPRACRERAAFTVEEVEERERTTNHDVAAFVDVVSASIGDEGRWIHYGLTSSDVLDTALATQIRAAGEIVVAGAESPTATR